MNKFSPFLTAITGIPEPADPAVAAHVAIFEGCDAKVLRKDVLFRLNQLRTFRIRAKQEGWKPSANIWFFELQRQLGIASHEMAKQKGWRLP